MKILHEVLMILCYIWSGVWLQRSTEYFNYGNTEGMWWAILLAFVFSLLGAFNLAFVKQDTKKEAK